MIARKRLNITCSIHCCLVGVCNFYERSRKLGNTPISLGMSVCPSGSNWTDFHCTWHFTWRRIYFYIFDSKTRHSLAWWQCKGNTLLRSCNAFIIRVLFRVACSSKIQRRHDIVAFSWQYWINEGFKILHYKYPVLFKLSFVTWSSICRNIMINC